jgi:large subunit ribosomal protein L2
MIISNIKYRNLSYCTSNGSYGLLVNVDRELNLCTLILPSGFKILLTLNSICRIGRSGNFLNKFIYLGKASSNLYKKFPKVRGVAMNPVDHPNGGRTKTNKPELSLWGWVAKHSH